MQVRKLKCSCCGASKVTTPTTSYLYCDYCGEFMGYDFERISSEVTAQFSMESLQSDSYQTYLKTVTRLGEASQQKNKDEFFQAIIDLHQLEIDLFPGRYSPKMKQEGYWKKYLDYYKRFWKERLEDRFFEKQEASQALFSEKMKALKFSFENGRMNYEFDDAMKAYFDAIRVYARDSAREIMQYESLMYYPEQFRGGIEDLLFKQTIAGYARMLDAESFRQVIRYLGIADDYVEIPDVKMDDYSCAVCDHRMQVPDGSVAVVCEQCGNKNQVKTHHIECMNCGVSFTPDICAMQSACPQCGSLFLPVVNS